jgi:hypothetical protein
MGYGGGGLANRPIGESANRLEGWGEKRTNGIVAFWRACEKKNLRAPSKDGSRSMTAGDILFHSRPIS